MQEGFRFAAIDVGSNAMRLFFCRVLENGEGPTFIKESMIRMPLRLGHDAFTENKISDETCDKFVNIAVLNLNPSSLDCLRPWLDASNITFSIFWSFNLLKNLLNLFNILIKKLTLNN